VNRTERKVAARKINKKVLELRERLWPDLDVSLLWNRKKEVGFTTIPRTLSYIMNMMDDLNKNKPLSKVYFALWCRAFDEMMVNVKNEAELANEAGFSGQRAIITWRERMKALVELGFIKAKEGATGKFSYVLLVDPHRVIEELYQSNKAILEVDYNSYVERSLDIGRTSNSEEGENNGI